MTTFSIPDMSCGHCKATVEQTIHAITRRRIRSAPLGTGARGRANAI